MRVFVVLGALAVLGTLAGCGDGDEGLPTDSLTPSVSATPGEIEVSWEEAQQLLRECKVTLVSQAHSLDVLMVLDDGTRVHTTEPGIDDVIRLGFDAKEKCGGQPEQIVTE